MSNVYLLWWDNCEGYDDHRDDVIGVFSTRENAEKAIVKIATSTEKLSGKYTIQEVELDKS